jgi:hypothetical protein
MCMVDVHMLNFVKMHEWSLRLLRFVIKSNYKVKIFVLQWRGEVNFGHRYPSGGKVENFETGANLENISVFLRIFPDFEDNLKFY